MSMNELVNEVVINLELFEMLDSFESSIVNTLKKI